MNLALLQSGSAFTVGSVSDRYIMNITFILLNPKVKADSLKTWRKTGNNIKVHTKTRRIQDRNHDTSYGSLSPSLSI